MKRRPRGMEEKTIDRDYSTPTFPANDEIPKFPECEIDIATPLVIFLLVIALAFTILLCNAKAHAQTACPDDGGPCITFTCDVKLARAYAVIDREDREIEHYRKLVRRLRALARGKR